MPEICKHVPVEIQKEVFEATYKAISHILFEYIGDGIRSAEGSE
jgi:hypothetical protein